MSLFEEQGLACQAVDMVQRCITNRASGAEMHRRWLQATFVKGPCPGSHEVCLLLLPQCCVRPCWGAECPTIGLELCAGLHSMHQELVPCTCRCEAELHGCAQTAACSLRWAPPEWLTEAPAATGFSAYRQCELVQSEVPAGHTEFPCRSA